MFSFKYPNYPLFFGDAGRESRGPKVTLLYYSMMISFPTVADHIFNSNNCTCRCCVGQGREGPGATTQDNGVSVGFR